MGALLAVPGSLAVATGLLTRLPVGRVATAPRHDVAAAAVLFPLVGAAIGAVVGGTAVALALALPGLLAAALAVAVELALTGAIHVDGLADGADGLAGRDPERALEIMRDHTLGTYGAAALTLDLVVKVAALGALAEAGAVPAVVAAYAVSRAAPLLLAAALPYARAGAGTGRLLADGATRARAVACLALAAAVATAATGAWALAAVLCLLLVAGAVGMLARRRLGGFTGDVLGAAIELTATLALAVAVAALAR